jgi:hypothetical protein
MDEGKFSIGASAHYGQESWGPADSTSTTSWSLNGDLAVKLNDNVALLGEFFTGENLQQYLGGVMQAVNPLGDPLPANGGWGMVQVRPSGAFLLNLGFGIDSASNNDWDVPDDDEAYTFRDNNQEVFGNLMYNVTKNVTAMFEVAYLKTKYTTKVHGESSTSDEYDAMRFQFALKAAIK